jgi:hypothetical protein
MSEFAAAGQKQGLINVGRPFSMFFAKQFAAASRQLFDPIGRFRPSRLLPAFGP